MIILGLTGGIGMGKSTTAGLFSERGIPVFDSDAEVHALYLPGEAGSRQIGAWRPDCLDVNGGVDRARLSEHLNRHPEDFKKLEEIIHPLVTQRRDDFLAKAKHDGHQIVVFDIPLLFETGADALVDRIVVVSAEDSIRRKRVLARPGMTREKLDTIISRQSSDDFKRSKADYIIDTDRGVDHARKQVDILLKTLLNT